MPKSIETCITNVELLSLVQYTNHVEVKIILMCIKWMKLSVNDFYVIFWVLYKFFCKKVSKL